MPAHQPRGILAHSSLQNSLNSGMLVGFFAWTACFRSFHSISIGLRSGLWLGHSKTLTFFCANHSLAEQFVCLGSLSYCMTHFLLSFSSQTDTLTFSCGICWYNSELIAPSMKAAVLLRRQQSRPKPVLQGLLKAWVLEDPHPQIFKCLPMFQIVFLNVHVSGIPLIN